MKEILSFLEDLKKNNDRDWFNTHKKQYKESRSLFLKELQQIINKLQFNDPRIAGLEAKDAMFRIYRDIRFSNDKTPYKTHFSGYIAKGGRKSRDAGYYVHVGNDEIFLGAGVYSPEKDELRAIRQEILYQPETFRKIVSENQKEGFNLMERDKLKTGPKDFPRDTPHADLLKYKHFMLSSTLDRAVLLNGNFAQEVAERFSKLVPFTKYLNTAMEFKGNE